MFAPRHEVTADELARVLRPGGRLCISAWTPEGAMGTFFRTLGSYMPPPPPFAEPPLLWGSEEHVLELFAETGVDVAFERETLEVPRFDSVDDEIEFATTKFGPMLMARHLLEPEGRWDALLGDLRSLLEDPQPAEYLVIAGRKA
jgi:SAM-dependent methyltransferase